MSEESMNSTLEYIHHQVTGTDTLAVLSLRYGVPVIELQQLNGLFSSEIWFKKELLIPVRERPLGSQKTELLSSSNSSIEALREKLSAERQKVFALHRASGCPTGAAAAHLRSRGQNFQTALNDCDWTVHMMRQYPSVTPESIALALSFCNNDYTKAELSLKNGDYCSHPSLHGATPEPAAALIEMKRKTFNASSTEMKKDQ